MILIRDEEIYKLKAQLQNLEATLDEFYSSHGSQQDILKDLVTKNTDYEEIISKLNQKLEQFQNHKNEVKDRTLDFTAKNEVLEKKITELQGLNQVYRDKIKNTDNKYSD